MVVYEQPTGRRIGPGLVVVLVLLAIVAGGGGYVVARQVLGSTGNVASPGGSHPATTPARTGATAGTPTGAATGTATAPQGTADPSAACPSLTIAAVTSAGKPGNLSRILYIKVARAGTTGAEVWICQDIDGTYYYQGHAFDGPFNAATSDVTILIGKPIRGDVVKVGTGFTATNPASNGTTQYVVTREVLTIITPGGDKTDYTVTKYAPN